MAYNNNILSIIYLTLVLLIKDMLLRNLRLWIKNNNRIYGQLRHNLDEIHASSGKEKTYQIAFLDKVSAMPRTYNQPVCPEVALLTSSDLVSTFHNYKRSVIIPAQYNGLSLIHI